MLFFWKYREHYQFIFILLVLLEVRLAKYVNRHRVILVSHLVPRMARIAQRTAPKFSQKTAEVAEDERWAFDAFSTIWSTLVAGNSFRLHRTGTTGSVLKTGATILSHIMSWFSGWTLLIRGNCEPTLCHQFCQTQPHLTNAIKPTARLWQLCLEPPDLRVINAP